METKKGPIIIMLKDNRLYFKADHCKISVEAKPEFLELFDTLGSKIVKEDLALKIVLDLVRAGY